MKTNPVLSRITIYPVKSLDGIFLEKAVISEGGCILHDREYAITDENGNFINGKTNPLVHSLRSTLDFENEIISFKPQHESTWHHFHLQKEKPVLQDYLTNYFGVKAFLQQNKTGRFLDSPDRGGATVLSTSSLSSVSSWFQKFDLDETRKRFRATLEIEGVPAFWEDHLFSEDGKGIEFKIGDVNFIGTSPCARCVVPTRNPNTGEVIPAFPKSFAKFRADSLPTWSKLKSFGHFYYFSVNCLIPASEIGKWIEVGNVVSFAE